MKRTPAMLAAASMLLATAAAAQTITWTPSAGPYGGPVSRLVLDSAGNSYAVSGGAIFRSTGGAWQPLVFVSVEIVDLAVTSSGAFLGATEGGGMIRSEDGGAHWEQANTGIEDNFMWGVAARSGGEAFAVAQFGTIYRTADNGDHWSAIGTLPNGVFPSGLRLSPSGDLYIETMTGGLHVVSSSGSGWSVGSAGIDPRFVTIHPIAAGEFIGGTATGAIARMRRGGDAWQISDTVTLSGQLRAVFPMPGGALLAATTSAIYRSDDNGVTWSRVDAAMPKGRAGSYLMLGDGSLLAATGSGVYRAPSPLGSSISFASASTGITMQPVKSLLALPEAIVAGTYTGVIFRSTDAGMTWSAVHEVPESYTSNSYGGVNGFARGRQGDLYASTYGGGLLRSTDAGMTWSRTTGTLPAMALVAVAIDSSGGLIASVAGEGLYRSADDGASWSKMAYSEEYAFPVVVAPNGDILTGAFRTLLRSDDGGATWRQRGTFPVNIHSILVEAGGDLYVGTDGYQGLPGSLSKVSSSGAITSLLTAEASMTAIVARSGSGIFTGIDGGGVYRSATGTSTWGDVSSGLADRKVLSLAVTADGSAIIAGTASGVYRSVISTSSVDDRAVERRFALADAFIPNPASDVTTLGVTLSEQSDVVAEIYSQLGDRVATIASGEMAAGEHRLRWEMSGVPSGIYWCRLRIGEIVEARRIVVAR